MRGRPRLGRPLVLEVPVRSGDGAGGLAGGWQARGTLWAEVTARGGSARELDGMPVSAVSYRIVVRAAPAGSALRPEAGHRLRDGGRVFLVRAVAESGPEGRYLTCYAEEEVAA